MTAFTLEEAALAVLGHVGAKPRRAGAVHRTGAPVLRGSMEAGTFEHAFFAAPAKGETDRWLRAARAALDAGRRLKRAVRVEGRVLSAAERGLAGLTAGAIRVFEEICTLARLNGGHVYPSYDRLADATALGRATVARALSALEEAGLLLRQRRFKRVEGEGAGPRWEQTSNAYRPMLSARLTALLPHWMCPAPIPVDAIQREADRAEELAAMRAGLSCRELAEATVGGALGRMLARLGARIDAHERESHNGSEPLPKSPEIDSRALA